MKTFGQLAGKLGERENRGTIFVVIFVVCPSTLSNHTFLGFDLFDVLPTLAYNLLPKINPGYVPAFMKTVRKT